MVEQRTENPRVTGSSPVPGIIHKTPGSKRFQGFLVSAKTPFQPFTVVESGCRKMPRWTFLDEVGQIIGVKLG